MTRRFGEAKGKRLTRRFTPITIQRLLERVRHKRFSRALRFFFASWFRNREGPVCSDVTKGPSQDSGRYAIDLKISRGEIASGHFLLALNSKGAHARRQKCVGPGLR